MTLASTTLTARPHIRYLSNAKVNDGDGGGYDGDGYDGDGYDGDGYDGDDGGGGDHLDLSQSDGHGDDAEPEVGQGKVEDQKIPKQQMLFFFI